MKLQMTDEEIKRRYLGADNKTQQIKVLAELNAAPKDAIRDALIRQGIREEELPPKRGRKLHRCNKMMARARRMLRKKYQNL